MVQVNKNQFAQQTAGFNNASFPSNPNQKQTQFQSEQAQKQANQLNSPKGLFQIPENLLQIIPWIPIGLEMLTGQKIPATGVLADILNGIQQLQFTQQQILNGQQQLWTKLESLENNASSQLNSLGQQIASTNKSFHLLATETKRSLEFNPRPQPEPEHQYQETEYQ